MTPTLRAALRLLGRVAQRALMSLAEVAEAVLQFLEALRQQPERWGEPLLLAAVRVLGRSAPWEAVTLPWVCTGIGVFGSHALSPPKRFRKRCAQVEAACMQDHVQRVHCCPRRSARCASSHRGTWRR